MRARGAIEGLPAIAKDVVAGPRTAVPAVGVRGATGTIVGMTDGRGRTATAADRLVGGRRALVAPATTARGGTSATGASGRTAANAQAGSGGSGTTAAATAIVIGPVPTLDGVTGEMLAESSRSSLAVPVMTGRGVRIVIATKLATDGGVTLGIVAASGRTVVIVLAVIAPAVIGRGAVPRVGGATGESARRPRQGRGRLAAVQGEGGRPRV